MDIYGKDDRIDVIKTILANTGYNANLATFVDALAPYWCPIKGIDPDHLYIHYDDTLRDALAGGLGIPEYEVDKLIHQCVDSLLLFKVHNPTTYEIAEWLQWNYSKKTKKVEYISTFTTGIIKVYFYDENDNLLYTEGFVMGEQKTLC